MEVSEKRPIGSDDVRTGIVCGPCKDEGVDKNAVCYCTDCNEFLCDTCTNAHKIVKISKKHQLLDGYNMPKQKFMSPGGGMCTKHNGKLVEYYCKIHDDFCCSVCATLEHKKCKVQYIVDIATEFEKSKEYKSLMSVIASLTQFLQNTKKISLKQKDDIGRIHLKFVSEVKKFRAEINQMLDSLEQSTLMQADTVRDEDTKSTESVYTKCDTMIAELEKMSDNIETQKKYKQQRQFVISAIMAQNQVKHYDSQLAELDKQCTIQEYCFTPNETVVQSIKAINSLGQSEIIKKQKGQTGTENRDKELPVLRKSVSLKTLGEYNIQHVTDSSRIGCWITGGVMLDNNMLAMADYNNFSVKVVDVNQNKVISCIKLASRPWDIARVKRDQIVVTAGNKLVFIKVGIVVSVVKEVDIGGSIGCIVYTNNTLIVSYWYSYCLRIIGLDGKVLKTIAANEIGSINQPNYIALSTDEKTLYVSDEGNNSVTSLDLNGTVKHVYKHDTLKGPRGLAVDREDNIYIAGHRSNNIHIISPQCTNIHVLQAGTSRTKGRQAVIYCERKNRLHFSQPHEFDSLIDNTVHVYEIQ